MGRRILIVEDDSDWREEIAGVLSGYELVEASSVEEAHRLIDDADQENRTIDLVILDLGLSKTTGIDSGLSVLAYLKDRAPHVPCIVFTGRSLPMSRASSLFQEYHIFEGLEKPRDMPRLPQVVRSALGQVEAQRGPGDPGKDVPTAPRMAAGEPSPATMPTWQRTATDKRALREAIVAVFSLEELEALCADIEQDLSEDGITLQVDLEIVGGTTKTVQVLRLIEHLDRRGYLDYLVRAVRRRRPGIA